MIKAEKSFVVVTIVIFYIINNIKSGNFECRIILNTRFYKK